jgi:hypothetical protein
MYVCYTNITLYTYVRYYPLFHVTAVVLGTYYPWTRGHSCVCRYNWIHKKTHLFHYSLSAIKTRMWEFFLGFGSCITKPIWGNFKKFNSVYVHFMTHFNAITFTKPIYKLLQNYIIYTPISVRPVCMLSWYASPELRSHRFRVSDWNSILVLTLLLTF